MQRFVASWFGSGLVLRRLRGSDAGSGTIGAAVAFLPAVWLGQFGWRWQALAAVAVTLLSLWSARSVSWATDADPGWVVVDEAAGTFLSVVGLGVVPAVAAFVVFRVADATKALPFVRRAESLPGSLGITADDLVAGLWALAAGHLLAWLV